ncbi:chloride channel protein EriC [Flammeovirgaceae bacterium 311]|nr:chloride channel protein EriC [Flammeovirgaceae bacterium 311]
MYRPNRYQLAFLQWRRKQSNNRIMPFLLSVVVGVIVSLAAILIKTIIHYFEIYAVYFAPQYFYFVLPLIGFFLVTLLNKTLFKSTSYFSGTKHVIEAIERKSSMIRFRLIYSKFITTGLTIGFGGSSGVEAAIITSGSAVGANVGRFLGLGYRLRTLLIGCGVAAGISAVYNAPMGGFIFALETILPEFTPTLLIPLLVSAATGKILFEFIMGDQLRFGVLLAEFSYEQIPLVIVLGVISTFLSSYLLGTYSYCSRVFSRIKSAYVRALAGGIALGSIIFILPPMYGEGYVSINALLNGEEKSLMANSPLTPLMDRAWMSMFFLFLLTMAKPLSTGICVNSGGEGGYFAPSLITGGFLGYFYYKLAVLLFPFMDINPATYMFLGMAAIFACIMNAPVTAIFLVAEITQSYQLFVPLMLVCAVAYFLKYYRNNLRKNLEKPLEEQKAKRMDRILLNQLIVRHLIVDETPLREDVNFKHVLDAFAHTSHDVLHVTDEQGVLVGVITLNDIRDKISDTSSYEKILARDLMHPPMAVVDVNEPASEVLEKFEKFERWQLPVVRENKFIGFISQPDLLNQYRIELTRVNRFFR